MDTKTIEDKIAHLFDNSGFDIVDIRISAYHNKISLQVFIDKENGDITLADCERWSDIIGSYIDMNSIIDASYNLEVSSPGIDRIIKKEKDFKRFVGRDVKIVLKSPFNGSRVYYSKIVSFENNRAIFENDLSFSMEEIKEVRLNPDPNELLKKKKGE